jgi:hypothetical protein
LKILLASFFCSIYIFLAKLAESWLLYEFATSVVWVLVGYLEIVRVVISVKETVLRKAEVKVVARFQFVFVLMI